MPKKPNERSFDCEVTCRVHVIIADWGDYVFFEKMAAALAILSSGARPIRVTHWKHRDSETVECEGFIVVSRVMTGSREAPNIAYELGLKLTKLIGTHSPREEQTIFLVHEKETLLLDTLCVAFGLDRDDISSFAQGEHFSYFSRSRDFVRSRHRKRIKEEIRRKLHPPETAPEPPQILEDAEPLPAQSVVKTEWRLILVEGDRQMGEDLRDLIRFRAGRQHLHINVDVRTTVEEALLGMSWPAFALSLNPRLPHAAGAKVGEWNGLKILPLANRLNLPVLLRCDVNELIRVLDRRQIALGPHKVISRDRGGELAEQVIATLFESPTLKHVH